MKLLSSIVNKAIVAPFYRQHAGAFLFSFFLLFGIQPSAWHLIQFHYSIILSILDLSGFFFVVVALWLMYTIKVVLFVRSCFRKDAYDFLYGLLSIEKVASFRLLTRTHTLMMMPVIGYGILILGVGIKRGQTMAGIVVLVTIIALTIVGAVISQYILFRAGDNHLFTRGRRWWLGRPALWTILLRYVFNAQFVSVLILKTISFFALYFFAKTDTGLFEDRMLWFLYITALIGHAGIIYKNFQFTETQLHFFRNMPLRNASIIGSLLLVYTILLIPEFWALRGVWLTQHSVETFIWMVLAGPSLLLLIHCLQYSEDMKMEEFLKLLFGIWVVFIFFSLSSNHWIMPLISFTAACMVLMATYYTYERRVEIEKPD